ncbi:MAG: excinuclease ABC subunit UvrB, partial [Pseudomonadota bacterium]
LPKSEAKKGRKSKSGKASGKPATRARKPHPGEMGPGTDREVPRRDTGGGAYGENVQGAHKPTLDEMGPHAMTAIPKGGEKPLPKKPTLVREFDDPTETKKRRGRPKKTGRPGS